MYFLRNVRPENFFFILYQEDCRISDGMSGEAPQGKYVAHFHVI